MHEYVSFCSSKKLFLCSKFFIPFLFSLSLSLLNLFAQVRLFLKKKKKKKRKDGERLMKKKETKVSLPYPSCYLPGSFLVFVARSALLTLIECRPTDFTCSTCSKEETNERTNKQTNQQRNEGRNLHIIHRRNSSSACSILHPCPHDRPMSLSSLPASLRFFSDE